MSENLRVPGPTPCRREVLEAMARQMVSHRGPEMAELLSRLLSKLGRYLETEHELLLLTASGTGGLEATVANLLSPGDPVVGVSGGAFGERFCAIAEIFGADLRRLEVEWGKACDPDALRRALREGPPPKAVLLTHNETSTGIAHPVAELGRVVREESDALLLVDAISSLGAMPLALDALGIDAVVTGSQKAWGVPPGLAILGLSTRAVAAMETARMPRYYFDLRKFREARDRGTMPFTPALSLLFALDVALDFMLEETAEGVFARHRRVAERARAGVEVLGLELFPDARFASDTVTAFELPRGIDEGDLLERLRAEYGTVLASGQGRLKGRILRIGHLGWVEEPEVAAAVDALGEALAASGFTTPA